MSSNFYYLVSSLPMLFFGSVPSITMAEFMAACHSNLSPSDLTILERASLLPGTVPTGSALLDEYYSYDTNLRNLIARHRATTIGTDPSENCRPENDFYSEQALLVQETFALSNPIDREKYLDNRRFAYLDSLAALRRFTIDGVIAYKLELMLCEKYQPLTESAGRAGLDEVIQAIAAAGADNHDVTGE